LEEGKLVNAGERGKGSERGEAEGGRFLKQEREKKRG